MRAQITPVMTIALCLACAAPAFAEAPKKKPAPPAAAPATPKADEKAVSELMGPYKWGMTLDGVLGAIEATIAERYKDQLEKSSDVYLRNKLRKDIKEEVAAVKRTSLKFDGQKTSWDASFLESEFEHKNEESMLIYHEVDHQTGKDQQRFFFFWNGKLWKQYIAFNMDLYKGKTFDDFRAAMEGRYGKGAAQSRQWPDGKERVAYVYWRAGGTYLRAIDQTMLYGNFCIALSDDGVEKTIVAARPKKPATAPKGTLVNSGKDNPVTDPNADVVERITGGNK